MGKMAKKHRNVLLKTYGHLYERHFSSRPGCFYCGDLAGTIDHCPPISFCEIKNQEWFIEKRIKFYKVVCCIDCNKKLADRQLLTLFDRAEYILKRLEITSNKLVHWSDDEMEEMSGLFKKILKSKQEKNKILFDRLRFCQELVVRYDDFPVDDL